MNPELKRQRESIDEIDARLVELLNQRARVAVEMAAIKRVRNMPVVDAEREAHILTRVREQSEGPLDAETLSAIFRLIIDESRRVQHEELGRSANA